MNVFRWVRSLLPPYNVTKIVGIDYYGDKNYDEKWFQLTVGSLVRLGGRINSVYYWFLYRLTPFNYHWVKSGLPPSWHDVDKVMFHTCFALLGRFVEWELGKATVFDEHHYRGYNLHSADGDNEKAIDLWLKYKYDLPKIEDDYYNDRDAFSQKMHFVNDGFAHPRIVFTNSKQEPKYEYGFLEKLEDSMLKELMELRTSLWT